MQIDPARLFLYHLTYHLQFTNEEWYSRRGYRLIKTVQNYYEVADKYGKIWDIKTVFMRKDIAGEEISTSAS